ncbi:MAG: hypothetical protein FWE85_00925, partial [Clostridiales bacterium]|nr:hypothetical protein [Clostridiales bacterium]
GISCLRGTGVAELRRALDAHFAYLQDSGERENKRRLRRRTELAEILRRRIAGKVEVLLQNRELAGELLELEAGRVDPYQLAERIMGRAEMLKN